MFKMWMAVFLLFVVCLLQSQTWTYQQDFGKYVSQGLAWGDYNNDGYQDFYFTNGFNGGATIYHWEGFLYKNNGDGTFDSVGTAGTIVTDKWASGGCSWGDYDNDGYIDLIVSEAQTTGAGLTNYSKNSLYRNNGDGTFSSATAAPVTTEDTQKSRSAAGWADYDNDSWLDVFESNATFFGTIYNNGLYLNNGDGTFTAANNNITNDSTARGGFAWADFDRDGDMDLCTASGKPKAETNLWVNTGNGSFTKFTLIVNMDDGDGKFAEGCSWGDYDNDGDLDLFVVVSEDEQENLDNAKLFRNDTSAPDNPVFTEMTQTQVGDIVNNSEYGKLSSCWADWDNDGDLDLFVGADAPWDNGNGHSYVYQNNGDGTFTSLRNVLSDSSRFAKSAGWADFDNDGDMDLLIGRDGPNRLLVNGGNSNHWINFQMFGDGINSNTTAIGAMVEINTPQTQIREVSSQTGKGSQNSMRAHFGLAASTTVDSVTVDWPGVSQSNSFGNIEADVFAGIFQVDNTQTPTLNFPLGGIKMQFTSVTNTQDGAVMMYRHGLQPSGNSFSGSATAPDASTVTPDVVAKDGYWTIDVDNLFDLSAVNASYNVSVNIAGLVGVNNPDKLVIMRRTGSGSAWQPLNTSRSGDWLTTGSPITVSASAAHQKEFAVGSNSTDNSLPVRLTSFTGNVSNGNIVLRWITQSETENIGFILERANESNGDFITIADYKNYPELKGQGNVSCKTVYKYIDRNAAPGKTYSYRLSDVNLTGVRTYHPVISVRNRLLPNRIKLYQNYPNPFNPTTKIKFEIGPRFAGEPISLSIFNNRGEKIIDLFKGKPASGTYEIIWNGKNAAAVAQASGIYFARLSGKQTALTQKLILLK